jgi:hypothetical protein
VFNSNKQRSNELLVGAVIRTSDLCDHMWACYQLSQTTSLLYLVININLFIEMLGKNSQKKKKKVMKNHL